MSFPQNDWYRDEPFLTYVKDQPFGVGKELSAIAQIFWSQ